jgi:hypothetical protein
MRTAQHLGISVVVIFVWTTEASAQYLPGPAPSVGDIQTQTVETLPAPQSRTDIGIG